MPKRKHLKLFRYGMRGITTPGLLLSNPTEIGNRTLEGDKDVFLRYQEEKKKNAPAKIKHPRSIRTAWGAELPVTGWRDYRKKTFEE